MDVVSFRSTEIRKETPLIEKGFLTICVIRSFVCVFLLSALTVAPADQLVAESLKLVG